MNKIVLTNAGIAELINAEQTGTAPVELVQVGILGATMRGTPNSRRG